MKRLAYWGVVCFGVALCALAVSVALGPSRVSVRAGGANVRMQPEPHEPRGVFSDSLGSYLTIEGILDDQFAMGLGAGNALRVDTVNGRKLAKPIFIPVDNVALPAGKRCVLKGYELGGMIGRPPAESDSSLLPPPSCSDSAAPIPLLDDPPHLAVGQCRGKGLDVGIDRVAQEFDRPVVHQRADRDHHPAMPMGFPHFDRGAHRRLGHEGHDHVDLAAQAVVVKENLAGRWRRRSRATWRARPAGRRCRPRERRRPRAGPLRCR